MCIFFVTEYLPANLLADISGFLFEAEGRTFRVVVYHVMSGTLMPLCMSFFVSVCLFVFT